MFYFKTFMYIYKKLIFMKKLLFILIASFSLLSCKKEKNETKVEITVTDGSGAKKSNFTVYQISDTKYNLYGEDPFFKDAQSVTNSNGVASFIVDDLNFAVANQTTLYYFCEYTIDGDDKTKNVGITLKEGDSKTGTLVLN